MWLVAYVLSCMACLVHCVLSLEEAGFGVEVSHGLLLAKVCWGGILTPPPHSSSLECEVTPQPPWLWHFMDWDAMTWAD